MTRGCNSKGPFGITVVVVVADSTVVMLVERIIRWS
jgi:hypothetical protein